MLKLNKQNQISPPSSPNRDRRALSQLMQNGTQTNSLKIDYSSNILVSPVQCKMDELFFVWISSLLIPGTHHKHVNTVLSESKENINTLNKPKLPSEPTKEENIKSDLQHTSYSLVKNLLATLHNVPPLASKETPKDQPIAPVSKPVTPVVHNIPPLIFEKTKKAFEIRIQELEKIKQDISKRTNNSGWITSEILVESLRSLFSMPAFISSLIFKRLSDNTKFIRWSQLQNFWQDTIFCKDTVDASDVSVKVFNCLKGKSNVITVEDLKPLVAAETVLVRIFYDMNCRNGRITLQTFRKSNLVDILRRLETEADVNNIASCFSYEHFYVIYCKFWELDTDHDLKLSMEDLVKYANYSLTTKIVERIFQYCYFLRSTTTQPFGLSFEDEELKMTYQDFIWFILSEEDKTTPTSIEYWFRCVDLDDDGIISGYEIEFFYEEQAQRMESLGMDPVPFEDLLCQILDMMPDCNGNAGKCQFTLSDLKRNKMGRVFDFIFNITKFVAYEKDPFSSSVSNIGNPSSEKAESEWSKFATVEYQRAVQEELGCAESS